jgi:NADH-quinone oxidoreductase subunit J
MSPFFHDSEWILFWIIAGLTVGSALMTLLAQNIVRSATWLLFTLGGTSGIFFLLGADFVGATQLLVYVGGTLILVVFGVMLTAQGPFITMRTSAAEWALSLSVGVALYVTLAISAWNTSKPFDPVQRYEARLNALEREISEQKRGDRKQRLYQEKVQIEEKLTKARQEQEWKAKLLETDPATAHYTDILGLAFLGQGAGPAHEEGDKVVRTSYLLPFEIVSVHLLVVLIGAAYLARAKRRRRATT